MKKAVFNPDDWSFAPSKKMPKSPSPVVGASSNLHAIEALANAIEASGIDITTTYSDWLAIAFALVAELGEDGRAIYHRLSRFNSAYDPNETDRQYTACLRDGSREITVASLFHIARSHGVSWNRPQKQQFEDDEDLRRSKSIKSDALTAFETSNTIPEASKPVTIGTFSQTVRNNLPDILKRIVADSVSEVDADLLILGSLTVFSACLPNVYGVYDRREVFSNLFLYVTARASSGKGRLSLCRHLVAPIHRELRERYDKSMEQFKHDQLQYVLNKKKGEASEPEEPPFLTLFIPANSTATVVYQTLSQNDGVGLLFETEGDTLANAFNSDLGNYSDGFRKAFHHETISYLRKKDREFVEIVKPKFSAILSGTPQQVFNLIPSAENGLFSRFVFYVMPTEIIWHDMFDEADNPTADELFKQIGNDFFQFHKLLATHPIRFSFAPDQRQLFNAFFSQTQEEYAALFGDDIIASVRRLGLILFRFAMILTVLRQMDNGTFPLPEDPDSPSIPFNPESLLICADSDFNTALAMVKVLLQHSVTVYQSLPRHDFYRPRGHRGTNDKRQAFYNALPDSFDRFTYLRTAAALNVTEKTAERYIAEFCKAGQLTHPANDKYQKPSS